MIEYIYIPTLGRSDKQVTYNSLPDEWKEKTILVVQKHEEEIYFNIGRYNHVIVRFVSRI